MFRKISIIIFLILMIGSIILFSFLIGKDYKSTTTQLIIIICNLVMIINFIMISEFLDRFLKY